MTTPRLGPTDTSAAFTVNGVGCAPLLPLSTPLLAYLRNDLALNGPKYGCGLGECGACTIIIDGQAARACVLTIAHADGREITTLEGLARDGVLDPVQSAFIDAAGGQCGYCLNGMVMTIKALLMRTPKPSETALREALRYNLCRCGAHVEILAAAMLAAERLDQ